MKTSVVIPTYNERQNLQNLVERIDKTLHDYEIIIVDDNSPDGTFALAEELSRSYSLKAFKRSGKLGLSSAVVFGFERSSGEIIGVIDADLQHPPEIMTDMIRSIEDGADVVVASRYVKGGEIEGWSKFRQFISLGARMMAKPITSVSDPMSGYFFMRREVVDGVDLGSGGFKILLEVLTKGNYKKLGEVPFTFRLREMGQSKFGSSEVTSYLKLLLHLYWHRIRALGRKKP